MKISSIHGHKCLLIQNINKTQYSTIIFTFIHNHHFCKNVPFPPQGQYWWCHYATWSMSMSSCRHGAKPSSATTIRTSETQPAPWVRTTLCFMRRTWWRGWTRVLRKTSIIVAGWRCLDLTPLTVHRFPTLQLLQRRTWKT